MLAFQSLIEFFAPAWPLREALQRLNLVQQKRHFFKAVIVLEISFSLELTS